MDRQATKADNERILTAEEENRQALEEQFQKMLADVKDAVDAQAKRVGGGSRAWGCDAS